MSGGAAATTERVIGKPNLEVFAATIEELAQTDPRLVVVTSDSRGSGKLSSFGSRRPDRVVEVGIAEQHLVGMAAGLAAGGKNVFAVSPASFVATRSLEQIKHDICYSDHPVTVVGISAGVSYGALGTTHHSLHDFAALRAIHNIVVVAPGDNWEAREAVRHAAESAMPVYLRFGKRPLPDLGGRPEQPEAVTAAAPDTPNAPGDRPDRAEATTAAAATAADFAAGRGRLLRDGGDGLIVTTGETGWRGLAACERLAEMGYSVGLLHMHTVKPLDGELLVRAAAGVRAVLATEEHSVHGGLGEACAARLLQAGVRCSFEQAAIPDEYTVTGSQEEILSHYGISPDGLAARMAKLLEES